MKSSKQIMTLLPIGVPKDRVVSGTTPFGMSPTIAQTLRARNAEGKMYQAPGMILDKRGSHTAASPHRVKATPRKKSLTKPQSGCLV